MCTGLWAYTGLLKATQGLMGLGYIWLQRVIYGYTGLHSYTGKHGATQGYIKLQSVAWGYTGLHGATQGYILYRVTEFCPQKFSDSQSAFLFCGHH